ncbi:hypothetical protein LXL04_032917 [Taraxacum kok-saghyz]
MVRKCVEMDKRSFVFGLKACEGLQAGESLYSLFCKVGFDCDLVVQNGLVHFYGDRGQLGCARKVFGETREKDVVSWTTLLNGYVKQSMSDEALRKGDLELGKSIYDHVKKVKLNTSLNLLNSIFDMYVKCGSLVTTKEIFDNMGTKDVFSWTSMINGYARNGELVSAKKLFDEMLERNIVSWNAMIVGYSQNNKPKEAISLFFDMEKAGLVPIESTLVCVLSACGQRLLRFRPMDVHLLHQAKPDSTHRDTRKCIHRHALSFFKEMIGTGLYKPDEITFIGVLSACSHGGLLTQGRSYFNEMETTFGLKPRVEHYACMIDLLGRIGLLNEAYELITEMPMEADKVVWGAVLNACRMHGNVELGRLATEKLLKLDPNDSSVYMLMESLCASRRKWDDVKMIRSMMRENGVKKTPGCSSVEVEGVFHQFLVSDKSHPKSDHIYQVLGEITSLSRLEQFNKLLID